MNRYGKGLTLAGIVTFALVMFAETFSRDNGNPINLSWLLWISGGITFLGIIILVSSLKQNK